MNENLIPQVKDKRILKEGNFVVMMELKKKDMRVNGRGRSFQEQKT